MERVKPRELKPSELPEALQHPAFANVHFLNLAAAHAAVEASRHDAAERRAAYQRELRSWRRYGLAFAAILGATIVRALYVLAAAKGWL